MRSGAEVEPVSRAEMDALDTSKTDREREEQIAALIAEFGVSRAKAALMIAIHRGVTTGDRLPHRGDVVRRPAPAVAEGSPVVLSSAPTTDG
jgi:hypothetical protein